MPLLLKETNIIEAFSPTRSIKYLKSLQRIIGEVHHTMAAVGFEPTPPYKDFT